MNKLISKMGTNEAKPNGALYIPQGTEKPFIAPLSVSKIPMVGERTFFQLSSMGVKTIQTLRQVPVRLLEKEFGKNGIALSEKANAIDYSPVIPYSEQKSLSTENTFHTDTTDIHYLRECIVIMAERLAFDLRKLKKLTACVTIKIRYSDFNTYTQQRAIALSSSDDILIATAKELFDKLYNKRLLVRLIGIRFSHLIQGNQQIDLFHQAHRFLPCYNVFEVVHLFLDSWFLALYSSFSMVFRLSILIEFFPVFSSHHTIARKPLFLNPIDIARSLLILK